MKKYIAGLLIICLVLNYYIRSNLILSKKIEATKASIIKKLNITKKRQLRII